MNILLGWKQNYSFSSYHGRRWTNSLFSSRS